MFWSGVVEFLNYEVCDKVYDYGKENSYLDKVNNIYIDISVNCNRCMS